MDDFPAQTLAPETALLWRQYLAAEAQGQRTRTLAALRSFVEALQAAPEEQRDQFAEAFCRQVADAGAVLPLRESLFADIIGPFLISARQQGRENAERWIAHFHPNFSNMPPSQKLIEVPYVSPLDLLREAFQRDPEDAQIQDQLIRTLAGHFAYAVHEVPSGVLYGADGATVAECKEWEADLALFREVAQKRQVVEKHEVAVRYWGFHFHGYADYLTHREQYQDYAAYIEWHWEEAQEGVIPQMAQSNLKMLDAMRDADEIQRGMNPVPGSDGVAIIRAGRQGEMMTTALPSRQLLLGRQNKV